MAARRFPVEAGHVLMFARSLGAADPEGGLPAAGDPAPPTFTIASAQFDPDYPLRPRPGVPWHGSGGDAGLVKEGAGGLHAEQHFTYHRPVRVGDVLIRRHPAGQGVGEARAVRAAAVPRADHRVPRRGGRARGDRPQRERPAGGIVTALRASELTVGQTFETVVVEDLKRTQIVQYAGRLRRLQPAAHRRGLHDEDRRLPVGVRARDADHGPDRAGGRRAGRPRRTCCGSASGSPPRSGRATR